MILYWFFVNIRCILLTIIYDDSNGLNIYSMILCVIIFLCQSGDDTLIFLMCIIWLFKLNCGMHFINITYLSWLWLRINTTSLHHETIDHILSFKLNWKDTYLLILKNQSNKIKKKKGLGEDRTPGLLLTRQAQ